MNKFIGIGRITNDLNLKTIGENKISVLQFTLAISRDYKNDKGEYPSDFIQCVAYKNNAEFIQKYFKKGDELAIEGKIQTRTYESNSGEKKYVVEVLIEHSEFTHGVKSNNNQMSESKEEMNVPSNYKSNYQNSSNEVALSDSDLPF